MNQMNFTIYNWIHKNKRISLLIVGLSFLLSLYFGIRLSFLTGFDFDCAGRMKYAQDIITGNFTGLHLSSNSINALLTETPIAIIVGFFGGFNDISIYIASAVEWSLLTFALSYYVGLDNRYHPLKSLVAFFFFIIPPIYNMHYNMRFESHVCSYLYVVLILIVLSKISTSTNSSQKILLPILFLLLFACNFSENITVPLVTIPIIFTSILRIFFDKSKFENIKLLAISCCAGYLSLIANKYLISSEHFISYSNLDGSFLSMNLILDNFQRAIRILLAYFNGDIFGKSIKSFTTILGCISVLFFLAVIVSFVVQVFFWSRLELSTQISVTAVIIYVCGYCFTSISKGYGLEENPRYFFPIYILLATIFFRSNFNAFFTWVKKKFHGLLISDSIEAILASLIVLHILISVALLPDLPLSKPLQPYNGLNIYELASFLESKGLTCGYAPYADASVVDVISEIHTHPVLSSETGLIQNAWMSKDEWYKQYANFIFCRKGTNGTAEFTNMNTKHLTAVLGEPSEICDLEQFTVWIWDKDISSYVRTRSFKMNDTEPYLLNLAWLSISDSCEKREDKIFLYPGGTQFGPYIELEEGNYEIEIQGDMLQNIDCDACSQNGNIEIDIFRKASDSIAYRFALDDKNEGVEFRCFNNSNETVSLRDVIIKKVKSS